MFLERDDEAVAEDGAVAKAAEDAAGTRRARALVAQSVPVTGTVAERYLTVTRGIPRPTAGWPDCIRYHPPSLALLLVATTSGGDVQSTQRVFLTNDGRKMDEAWLVPRGLQAVKQTDGPKRGSTVRLPGHVHDFVQVAEGPETAITVWAATGRTTHIALGGLGSYHPEPAEPGERTTVIACQDVDAPDATSTITLPLALDAWIKEHRFPILAAPYDAFRNKNEKDFNDLLRSDGIGAVKARIEAAIQPRPPVVRQPVAEARMTLDDAVGDFGDRMVRGAGDIAHALRVDTGTGKSDAFRRMLLREVARLRENGSTVKIAVAVPSLKLADEAAGMFNTLARETGFALTAEVWRGRQADDPSAPGQTMCRRLDTVEAARKVKAAIELSCCRNTRTGTECPFYQTCGYQEQKRRPADVRFMARNLLFTRKPKAFGDLAAVIIDESMWQTGLTGEGTHWNALSVASLKLAPEADEDGNNDFLVEMREKAVQVARTFKDVDAPMWRRSLVAAGITLEAARAAIRAEWGRLLPGDGLYPDMLPEARSKALKQLERNSEVPKFVAMWKAFATLLESDDPDAMSGWAWAKHDEWEQPVLRLKGRRDIRKGWRVPTLLLDATMNVDLVRHYLPHVTLQADVRVAAPHQRVIQVYDEAYGRWSLMPEAPGVELSEKQRRTQTTRDNKRGELIWALRALARPYKSVLVVAQKDIEAVLKDALPPNCMTAHHNSIAGRDEWGQVDALVVVGRTQPGTIAVEAQAEALTGLAVKPLGKWFRKKMVPREMADGSVVYGAADFHPHPVSEAIRWQDCEGELMQIIGRARAVNRTADNPVDIWILASTPLPVPVDRLISRDELSPSLAERMLLEGGVAFENYRHAAAAYTPSVFTSEKAAEHALARAEVAPKRYKDNPSFFLTIAFGGNLGRCVYQLAGVGGRPCRALIDPAVVGDDPAAAIARLLGKPVKFARME